MIKNYGKRTCLECETEFTAKYPGHVTCSLECYLNRKTSLKRARHKRYYEKRKAYIADLLKAIEEYNDDTTKLTQELELKRVRIQEQAIRIKELEGIVESLRAQLDAASIEAQDRPEPLTTTTGKKDICQQCGGPTSGTRICTACWQANKGIAL